MNRGIKINKLLKKNNFKNYIQKVKNINKEFHL